jgi:N-acetylglutamate synthase-like GNAT family acetyltransferase
MRENFEEQSNGAIESGEISAAEPQSSEVFPVEKKESEKSFESDVKKYARNFFERIYENNEIPGGIEVFFDTQNKLSILSNSEKEWNDERRYTKQFREATRIFLEEFLDYFREKGKNKETDEFLGKIHDMFFAFSPNITSALDFGQRFDFASKATREADLQAYIGGGIIGELAYDVGWDYDPNLKKDQLLESFNKSSVPEKLDKLNLMEILGAELIGGYNAYNYGDKKIMNLLEKIKQTNDNPFISYYLGIVKDTLKKEYIAPSSGLIHYANNPGNARLWKGETKEQLEETADLKRTIAPDISLKRGQKLTQVADNVVALLNHANVPIKYAQVDLNNSQQNKADFIGFEQLMENNKNYLGNAEIEDGELLFQHLYRPEMRERIESEFGVKLNELPFHYHVHFLKFLSEKNIDEAESVKDFLNQSQNEQARINRIKSFLSLEQGEEMGRKIFGIGESLDQESADAIFAKYAEIVDLTGEARGELSALFKESKNIPQDTIESTIQNLIKKANGLLVDFSEKIEAAKRKDKTLDNEKILTDLENYKTDLLLTANVYKSLKETGAAANLEDFKGVVFEQRSALQIDEGELEQMARIYASNYEKQPGLQDALVPGFREKIKTGGDDVTVYMYKKDGAIFAFNRFDLDRAKNIKHFASFNVNPVVAGSSIGRSLLDATLEKETANGQTIQAECLPETDISHCYIEKCGFIVKKVSDFPDTKIKIFEIERKPENADYSCRKLKPEEIITQYISKFSGNKYKEGNAKIILISKKTPLT